MAPGKRQGDASPSVDALLFRLFGFAVEPGADIPVAAVTRLLDLGVIDKGWWLRADPIHLVPGRRGLLMAANRQLNLTDTEAQALAQDISDTVLEDGWVLKAPNPHRWYLKPPTAPRLTTTPIDQALGHDIEEFLPAGPDAKAWHMRMNELQILLHTSQTNVEREQRGVMPVNSLWFWGGGGLPALAQSTWTSVASDDLLTQALARLSDAGARRPPANYREWSRDSGPGQHLLVFDRQEQHDWIGPFETNWVLPLVDALKLKQLDRLVFHSDTRRATLVTPAQFKSRWNWRLRFRRKSR